MYHILLVEDTEASYLIAKRALAKPEIDLKWCQTIAEAIKDIDHREEPIDLVLLDLLLPDGDGLTVLNHIQNIEELREVPVLLLTSKEDLASKISTFSLGAEDYLIKPINPIELWARVETRLKKSMARKKNRDVIKRGGLIINIPLMQVTAQKGEDRSKIELTGKEFRILAFLAQNENYVFTRTQLVKAIWGEATHVVERTVDSHICGLRRKLGEHAFHVENISGAGYRFVGKPTSVMKSS